MASRRDEIEKCVNSVVPEARVTLDTGLLRQNIVILAFQVSNDLLEAAQTVKVTFVGQLKYRVLLTRTRCQCCRQSRGYPLWSRQCGHHLPQVL